jgi:hypothetical protein
MKSKYKDIFLIALYYCVFLLAIVFILYLNRYYNGYMGMAYWPKVFLFGGLRAFVLILLGFMLPRRKVKWMLKNRSQLKINLRKIISSCVFPLIIIAVVWLPVILVLIFGASPIPHLNSLVLLTKYPTLIQICWILIGFNISYSIGADEEKNLD